MSSGIPLSGVAMTSLNTPAASVKRRTGALSLASSGASARVATNMIRIFINLFGRPSEPQGLWATRVLVHEQRQRVVLLSRLGRGWLAAPARGKQRTIG